MFRVIYYSRLLVVVISSTNLSSTVCLSGVNEVQWNKILKLFKLYRDLCMND